MFSLKSWILLAAVLSLAARVSVPCLLATSCLLTTSQFCPSSQLLALAHLVYKLNTFVCKDAEVILSSTCRKQH